MKAFTIRLIPGDNLQEKLIEFVQKEKLSSGKILRYFPTELKITLFVAFIITCVGSLTKAVMRMANSTTIKTFEGWDLTPTDNDNGICIRSGCMMSMMTYSHERSLRNRFASRHN